MNRFMDALWELKLRVDAHDEQDEKANRAFETLKRFIESTEAQTERVNSVEETDKEKVISILKKHVQVQEHPDTFFYREYPERLLIDLRYTVDTSTFTTNKEETAKKNKEYNLVKKVLGLEEYKE